MLMISRSALESTTDPPAVFVPASAAHPEFTLSVSTCPIGLLQLFRLWSKTVSPLQALPIEYQHDVARLLCGLPPEATPVSTRVAAIAADLNSVSITISQRKTYLERYTQDLEEGLGSPDSRRQSFERPPEYPEKQQVQMQLQSPAQPSPTSIPDYGRSQSEQAASSSRRSQLPPTDDPTMVSIRETLYAALAEAMLSSRRLPEILKTDPAKGYVLASFTYIASVQLRYDTVSSYFVAVALAIIEVASQNVSPDGQRIRVVSFGYGHERKQSFGIDDAPLQLRVFARELLRLGGILRQLQESDDERAMELAMQDQPDSIFLTQIELLKEEIEVGAENATCEGEEPSQIRTIANAINRMSLGRSIVYGPLDRHVTDGESIMQLSLPFLGSANDKPASSAFYKV